MTPANRIMTFLLKNVFRINCSECARHWLYDDFLTHKTRGQCRRDPTADNAIASLSHVERRPTVVAAPANGQAAAAQIVEVPQVNAVLSSIYVLERDSKFVYEYDL